MLPLSLDPNVQIDDTYKITKHFPIFKTKLFLFCSTTTREHALCIGIILTPNEWFKISLVEGADILSTII